MSKNERLQLYFFVLILAELAPFLIIKNQRKLISLLNSVDKLELDIIWDQIIEYQHKYLKKGINGISIPDLIIAQNAIQNHCEIYSLEPHRSTEENEND